MSTPSVTALGETEATDVPEQFRAVIVQALAERATDIHLDPKEDGYKIRYRIDGRIQPKETLSHDEAETLLNQIRVTAEMGVDRSREPSEGRIAWKDEGRTHGIRISFMPTLGRESAHLRLLDPPEEIMAPSELGMADYDLEAIQRVLQRNEGLIVIAGPTGAGKTTTLYSLVSLLDLEGSVGVSIEDPVEYDLPYVRQVQVNEEHGLSMQEGLVTLLRMDPDLIMVGETRDEASTLTAAQAAASGHFVFTTLHANSPHMVVAGLRFLGVPDHLLGNTLRLIVVQNLVRRLCPECAASRQPAKTEKALFKDAGLEAPDKLREAAGCDACNNYGYQGRMGIFQVTPVLEDLAMAIAAGKGPHELQKQVREMGIHTLFHDALLKVADGTTSLAEVLPYYRGNRDVTNLMAE